MRAEPLEVLADGNDVLVVLLGRVGVVITQVKQTAVFLRRRIIDINCLGAADMQIAVRLGRKTRMDALRPPLGEIAFDNIKQEISKFSSIVPIRPFYSEFQTGQPFRRASVRSLPRICMISYISGELLRPVSAMRRNMLTSPTCPG